MAVAGRPTLVLLHGLGGSPVAWAPAAAHLDADLDVRVLALPGHHGGPVMLGRSAPSLEGLVAATERQLATTVEGPVHLAGLGLGGRVAIELARRGRARSVTAVAPLGGWLDERDLRRMTKLLHASRGAILGEGAFWQLMVTKPRVRRVTLRTSLERGDRLEVEALEAIRTAMESCVAFEGLVASLAAPGARLQGGDAPLDVPVRLVWGAKDRLVPFARYGRPVVAALGGPEVVLVPGAGHLASLDEPEAVARTVLGTVAAAQAAVTPSRADRPASG